MNMNDQDNGRGSSGPFGLKGSILGSQDGEDEGLLDKEMPLL